MWEVREQGLNIGRRLGAEPAGNGQIARIRNKRGFFIFYFSEFTLKIDLKRKN